MEIYRLGPGDEARVAHATPLFDRPPHPAAVQAFLADPASVLLVAYIDGAPVGFLRAHELRQLDTPRPQVLLYEIAVTPAFQRRGVARRLIDALKTICGGRDAAELFVITTATNLPAMALYRSTGGQRDADDDVVFVYPFT